MWRKSKNYIRNYENGFSDMVAVGWKKCGWQIVVKFSSKLPVCMENFLILYLLYKLPEGTI